MKNHANAIKLALILLCCGLIAASCSRDPMARDADPGYSATTPQIYRALIGSGGQQAAEATVIDDGSGVVVVNTVVSAPLPDDNYRMVSPYLPVTENGVFVPNDGQTWWAVPFDPGLEPLVLQIGMRHYDCTCTSSPLGPGTGDSGDCKAECNGSGVDCISLLSCPSQSCSISEAQSLDPIDYPYILIPADGGIDYNSMHFTGP